MTDSQAGMTIWQHLDELRRRLLIAVVALFAATLASFALTERFISLLAVPVGGIQNLQAIEVTESIGVFMRVSLLSGFILSLPIILYELAAFIFPGLTPAEKRWVLFSIPLATLFFAGGAAFTYLVMLPAAVPFLTGFLGVETVPRISSYINFVTSLMFWVGLAFEFPLVVFVLAKLRLVSAGLLARGWRVALVAIAVLSAVITPTPDPVNMALLMAPLFGLYLLSLLFALLARR